MNEFKNYHPIVNLIYFVFTIGLGCFLLHPAFLCISLVSGFAYLSMLRGKKSIRRNLMYLLPLILATAIINPLFNHKGITVLAYFPSGNPLTMEAVLYGICASAMMASVICHFFCYNEVMTSDKFIYLFGKVIPALSLVISMTLRFIPKFMAQFKVVINAQKCMGRYSTKGSVLARLRSALSVLSAMTTWSLENAIETSDSMKARGYGLPGRTSFSIYKLHKRDIMALLFVVVLGVYTLIGNVTGQTYFSCFPYVNISAVSFKNISYFIAYAIMCMCPIIIEIREVIRWKALKSKN